MTGLYINNTHRSYPTKVQPHTQTHTHKDSIKINKIKLTIKKCIVSAKALISLPPAALMKISTL